jgi:hypothetical protein
MRYGCSRAELPGGRYIECCVASETSDTTECGRVQKRDIVDTRTDGAGPYGAVKRP